MPAPVFTASLQPHTDRLLKTSTLRCEYISIAPALVVDPNTKSMSGLDYDIVEAIARKLDIKVEWLEETNWGISAQGINSNRVDMLCNTNWGDPRKAKQIFYSTPYGYSPVYAVVRAGDHRFDAGLQAANDPAVTFVGYGRSALPMAIIS